MAQKELCPACGCTLGDSQYQKKGVVYCCKPCADASECECGCCTAHEHTESSASATAKGKKSK